MVADNGMGPDLLKALIAARKKFKPLVRNKVNPFFKSMYADLEALHDAVDGALADNGLTTLQPIGFDAKEHLVVRTTLAHQSGQFISSEYPLPGGVKPQELASAVTYARRVSLAALLSIPQSDDDDGEATEGRVDGKVAKQERQAEAKPAKVDKKVVSWLGNVTKVNNVANGKWMIVGADGSEFGTSTPEHSAVASDSIGKCRVKIAYMVNQNGIKVTQALEPEVKNG